MAAYVGSGLILGWLLWLTLAQVYAVQWNAPRLAPAAAVARGLAIYGTAEQGPFLGWGYGPVFPVVFGSVAWFSGQVQVLTGAWLLNGLIAFGVAWLFAREGDRRAATPVMAISAMLALGTGFGRNLLGFLHVDLLCCAFGALACLGVARGAESGERWPLAGAALATMLAIGTKQVAVALVPALLGWFWLNGPRPAFRRYAAWLAICGIGFGAWAVCLFGFEPLVFNLWTYHRHNPSVPGWPLLLANWVGAASIELLPVVGVSWLAWRARAAASAEIPAARRLESLLLWVALAHLPLGLLAATKVAGGLNSVHTFHYLALWLQMRLARTWAAMPALRRGLALFGVLAAVQGAIGVVRADLPLWPETRRLDEEQALADARRGQVYFPWNPLVTILSERRVRPFDDALVCLQRSGFTVSREAVLAAIPPGALVVYPDPVQSTRVLDLIRTSAPPPPPPNR